ncbi:MAG: phosphoribosylanthranilate isomerase [Solirubrobacteraceae bacterium]|nr:phosphoribosylanthranilate isomerase [Solirubrobacteraceae bacterium]
MATRIKHCGITSVEDAELAVEAGAWALGMIFWPQSPRSCAPDVAVEIGRRTRRRVELAGVFVDQSLDEIAALAEMVPLSLVQLHGTEGTAFCAEVARRTGARVIKAERIASKADLQALQAFRSVDYHLVDAHVEGLRGGTGQTLDWSLLAGRHSEVPLILSGGLTPENVGEAVTRVAPSAVDVASGTESAPGVKDPDKLRAFGEVVAAADAAAEPPPEPEPEAAEAGEETETETEPAPEAEVSG